MLFLQEPKSISSAISLGNVAAQGLMCFDKRARNDERHVDGLLVAVVPRLAHASLTTDLGYNPVYDGYEAPEQTLHIAKQVETKYMNQLTLI